MSTSDSIRVPRLLTVRQAAAATGLQRFRLYQLIREGSLPHIRVGKTFRLPEDQLARWIQEQAEASVR